MNCIEIGTHRTNASSKEAPKSCLLHYGLWGGDYLKRILHCTKYIEINICHSDVQSVKKITEHPYLFQYKLS